MGKWSIWAKGHGCELTSKSSAPNPTILVWEGGMTVMTDVALPIFTVDRGLGD
ncbi:MAG: hypothetical protein AB8U69_03275 [Anaplasma ovis]